MRRDAAPDPVRRAEEVPAVALVEELDGAERRHADVGGLAARLREAVERLRRRRRRAPRRLSRAARTGWSTAPGHEEAAAASRWISPWRSRAPTSREVVLFGSSSRAESAPTVGGSRRLEDVHEDLRGAVDGLRALAHIVEPLFHDMSLRLGRGLVNRLREQHRHVGDPQLRRRSA